MSLSDLPIEILLEITHYLDDVATNALGSTNSQVYDILIGYLYRQDLANLLIRHCLGFTIQF
jgi:hypothetical protein